MLEIVRVGYSKLELPASPESHQLILEPTSQNGHHDKITNIVEAEKSLSETGKAH